MIDGTVSEEGVPVIALEVGGEKWIAIIDTGFNGALELPAGLQGRLAGRFVGRVVSQLASGHEIEEDLYLVEFLFDGEMQHAEAMFAPVEEILIGTRLLKQHRLIVDFRQRTVTIEQP